MAADVGFNYIPTADASWSMDDIEKFVASRTPMGRMVYPVDIARVVEFLASEDAGWMSGESFFFFSRFHFGQWFKADYRAKPDDLWRSVRVKACRSEPAKEKGKGK